MNTNQNPQSAQQPQSFINLRSMPIDVVMVVKTAATAPRGTYVIQRMENGNFAITSESLSGTLITATVPYIAGFGQRAVIANHTTAPVTSVTFESAPPFGSPTHVNVTLTCNAPNAMTVQIDLYMATSLMRFAREVA